MRAVLPVSNEVWREVGEAGPLGTGAPPRKPSGKVDRLLNVPPPSHMPPLVSVGDI